MKRRLCALLGLLVLACVPLPTRADAPSSRHLRYALDTTVGGLSEGAVVDLDIGSLNADRGSPIVLSEQLVGTDLGSESVTLERNGAVRGASDRLTFEEEVLLDAVALQFEHMNTVERGEQWDRSALTRGGKQTTHFTVLKSIGRNHIDLGVSRTIAFLDGTIGNWSGQIRYDAAIVVPTSLAIVGEIPVGAADARHLGSVAVSARLIGDSFAP